MLWLGLLAAGLCSVQGQIYTPFTFATVLTLAPPGMSPFAEPNGLAIDAAGNLFVADTDNQVIRKVRPGQSATTLAGQVGVAGNDDGFGVFARFNSPWGVAVDPNGIVFVADNQNYVIRRITPDGSVSTIAGHPRILQGPLNTIVTGGFANGQGTNAMFGRPVGVVLDRAGNLFIADTGNNAIRKITPGGLVSSFAGVTELKTNSLGLFDPVGGSVDGPGNVARFNEPTGLDIDTEGNLYVGDIDNHTVRKVTPAGFVTTIGGTPGRAGFLDGPAATSRFAYPAGVAVDRVGNVYVSDTGNYLIRRITPDGLVTTVAGLRSISGTQDGTGKTARFNFPTDLRVDTTGALYVVDTRNNRIRVGRPALNLQQQSLVEGRRQLRLQSDDPYLTNSLAALQLQVRDTLPAGTDTNWTSLVAPFFLTNGVPAVEDVNATLRNSRFYRVLHR